MTEGPVFGSVDNFEGLGIFFDTYDNERAHVSVPLYTYMHRYILLNSLKHIIASYIPLCYGNAWRWYSIIQQR